MHEMSLLNDLMKKVQQLAEEAGAARVSTVRVRLGALAHISPEHLREHFVETAVGTISEGAWLEVIEVPDVNDSHAQDIILDSIDVDD